MRILDWLRFSRSSNKWAAFICVAVEIAMAAAVVAIAFAGLVVVGLSILGITPDMVKWPY